VDCPQDKPLRLLPLVVKVDDHEVRLGAKLATMDARIVDSGLVPTL